MNYEKTGTLLGTLLLGLSAWLFTYFQSLSNMVGVWDSSETYTHCFLIVPVVIYLLYERKAELAVLDYTPSLWALVPLAITQFVFVIATVIGINVLTHLAAYFSFIFILWLVLGTRFIIFAQFPLFFLSFSVPLGEELVPLLQQITADLSVVFIELAQVPVFRDGLYLHIPGGSFVVAEACAGIRFLIATISIGTLYSYLFFYSFKRRLIFMIICILVPIIANGIRAAGIVIIGHYSDMKHAVGADHLVYGWLFFSVVLGLIIIAGSIFQETAPKEKKEHERLNTNCEAASSLNANSNTNVRRNSKIFAISSIALIVILGSSLLYINWITNKSLNTSASLETPHYVQNLVRLNHSFWGPSFDSADSQHHFVDPKTKANIYIAQYANESDKKELINWSNKLFDYDLMSIASRRTIQIDLINSNLSKDNVQATAEIIHLTNVKGEKYTLVYFYQVNHVMSHHSFPIKFEALLSKLKGQTYMARIVQIVYPGEKTNSELQALIHDLFRGKLYDK